MTHLISRSHDFLDKNFRTYRNDSNMNNKYRTMKNTIITNFFINRG